MTSAMRKANIRAAIWATAIVAPAFAFYYWENITPTGSHGVVLNAISSVCGVVMVPGAFLAMSLASLLAPGYMDDLGNFFTSILIIFAGGALLDWLLYFGVLLLIFRWRQRRAAKAGTAHL